MNNRLISVLMVLVILATTCEAVMAAQSQQVVAPKGGGGLQGKPAIPEAKPVVLLRVNGKALTSQDYASFLQRNQVYLKPAMETQQGKAAAIRALVGGVLIKEVMMKQEGLLPNGEKSGAKEVSEAYEKLAEQHFPIPPVPDEKALFDYYQAHLEEYGLPEMVRISQVQFRFPENANATVKQQAKDRAAAALKRLEAGEDFGKLAMELTENPMGKYPKGDLGFLVRNQNPWLKEATKNLKPGEHSGILESPAGFEILMVTDIRDALTTPFANARDKVVQAMRDELQTKARDAYIKELASSAKIEIVEKDLKELFPQGVFN